MHVQDVVGGEKACRLVSDDLAAENLGLSLNVRDAAGGGKVSFEPVREIFNKRRHTERERSVWCRLPSSLVSLVLLVARRDGEKWGVLVPQPIECTSAIDVLGGP